MLRIKDDDVGTSAGRERADAAAERLPATGERAVIETPAGRPADVAGKHVAGAVSQPLGIFELAQFHRRVDRYVGIGADSEATAASEKRVGGENAVAEIGLGERT